MQGDNAWMPGVTCPSFEMNPAVLRAVVDHTELRERRRAYLRAVVRSAGLESMAALAKELDITQSTLTNIQSATRSASPELIKKIERLAPKIEGGSILGARALPREADVNLEGSRSIGERLKEAYRERLQELQSSEEMTSKNVGEAAKNFDSMASNDVFIFVSASGQILGGPSGRLTHRCPNSPPTTPPIRRTGPPPPPPPPPLR
jgi:hypothetical protein